jgi:hypothetical protein
VPTLTKIELQIQRILQTKNSSELGVGTIFEGTNLLLDFPHQFYLPSEYIPVMKRLPGILAGDVVKYVSFRRMLVVDRSLGV